MRKVTDLVLLSRTAHVSSLRRNNFSRTVEMTATENTYHSPRCLIRRVHLGAALASTESATERARATEANESRMLMSGLRRGQQSSMRGRLRTRDEGGRGRAQEEMDRFDDNQGTAVTVVSPLERARMDSSACTKPPQEPYGHAG